MTVPPRSRISRLLPALLLLLPACSAGDPTPGASSGSSTPVTSRLAPTPIRASSTANTGSVGASAGASPTAIGSPGSFTIAFAGDVHFAGRVGRRLAADPATAFGVAAKGLGAADLTMVNLETAVATGGERQNKAFTFRAPPAAFAALKRAGVDVATMANNHGADYGAEGLQESLRAIRASSFPVVGIGRDADAAFRPYRTTLNGTKVAIFGADQIDDETTLRLFSAGPGKPGVANAHAPRLLSEVSQAKAAGYLVIVYVHWGVEFQTCPSALQTALADDLARAGATVVVGAHAHVLQGAGWRPDGSYVAYGLGNYLWWMSFGNNQDDNGVLTLSFRDGAVVADRFAPSQLDDTGVPVPSTGAEKRRIDAEWKADRRCSGLSAHPPR